MTTPTKRSLPEPPGPVTRSLLGSLSAFREDPIQLVMDVWHQYGDIVRMRFGPVNTYFVNHPDYVQHVLQDNHMNYVKGRLYKEFERFFGNGMLITDGEIWVKHRRIAQRYFHPNSIARFVETVTASTQVTLDSWEQYAKSGEIIDGHEEMVGLALRQVGMMSFSMDLSDFAHEAAPSIPPGLSSLIRDVGKVKDRVPRWIPTAYNRRTRRVQNLIYSIVNKVLEQHKNGEITEDDIVSELLLEQKEGRMTEKQVFDELTTILLAGHDTSAAMLCWMAMIVSTRPDIRKNLEEEVDRVLNGRVPTLEDIPKLYYTRIVVMETLRLYPSVWIFPRDLVEDDEIGGYHIRKGSTMLVSPFMVHRHPEFWENPEEFNPERFTPGWEKKQHSSAYIPFGFGPRQCLGRSTSSQTLLLSLAMIVQRFRIELAPTTTIVPAKGAIMHPEGGLHMKIKKRT